MLGLAGIIAAAGDNSITGALVAGAFMLANTGLTLWLTRVRRERPPPPAVPPAAEPEPPAEPPAAKP